MLNLRLRVRSYKFKDSDAAYGIEEEWKKAIGEKGRIIDGPASFRGGKANIFCSFHPFDPSIRKLDMLVSEYKEVGSTIEVRTDLGNVFTFEIVGGTSA